jgi:hypothetical protein
MTRIHVRRRMAAVAVGVMALATTASAAAAAGSGPQTNAGKNGGTISQNVAKADGKGGKPKPDPKQDAALAAVAKDLGVTVAQLDDALRATKEWVGATGTNPTPELVAAHVAGILHVPSAKVLASFKAHGLFDEGTKGKPGPKKPGDGKGGGTAALDKAAKDLGVTRAKLEDALTQTKIWIGNTGAQPTPEVVAGHVASILGLDAARVLKVLEVDGVIGTAPAKPLG